MLVLDAGMGRELDERLSEVAPRLGHSDTVSVITSYSTPSTRPCASNHSACGRLLSMGSRSSVSLVA
jgi:hypothetical protein